MTNPIQQIYIRFGEIPMDERSTEHRGSGDGVEPTKKLDGVSVYDCFNSNGNPQIVIPTPINEHTLDTLWGLLNYSDRPVYLVSGDKVGAGSDGEPLIKNIKIIEKIQLV